MKTKFTSFYVLLFIALNQLFAQDTVRQLPKEWDGLVYGARIMDRFEPIQKNGKLTSNVWGAKGVIPRYVDNGIEDSEWSYWGGNILKDDAGKYHQFVCRWREDSKKGHMEWPNSIVVHAISDKPNGSFKVLETIGKGHNPEAHQLTDGRFFIYVQNGFYLANTLSGSWTYQAFVFDQRQRPIQDHISNCTFAQPEDGSYLMICRGGGIWFSQSGLPPYLQVSQKTIYPPYEGHYEDPVVWRTGYLYHAIVNDWLGRIAYYLISPDGINWKLEPGTAYAPGIAKYEDGTLEDWYKFERIKIYQDKYGRAILANFAVIDTIKQSDMGSDNHSSKNIAIPLTVERFITLLNPQKIDESTTKIQLKIQAEEGFNPQKDIDLKSLRFGAPEKANYGKGCQIIATEKSGSDLILIFDGKNNGFTNDDFTGKLIGKTKKGKLIFGYAKLPWIDYKMQALSAKYPELLNHGKNLKIEMEVQNFGQVNSAPSPVKIEYLKDGVYTLLCTGKVPELALFAKTTVVFNAKKIADINTPVEIKVTIDQENQKPAVLSGAVIIR